MLREACLIMPRHDNDGADLTSEHTSLAKELSFLAGGVTMRECSGVWFDGNKLVFDNNIEYTVALPQEEEVLREFERICLEYGARCRQHAVYYRMPDGTAVIKETGWKPEQRVHH